MRPVRAKASIINAFALTGRIVYYVYLESVSKVKRHLRKVSDCYCQDGLKAQKHIAQGNALGDC